MGSFGGKKGTVVGVAALVVASALLPRVFPDVAAIHSLFGGSRLLIFWAVIIGMIVTWRAIRSYVRSRYPANPKVPRGAYLPLTMLLVVMLVMAIASEHYSRVPPPQSQFIRIYLALFGEQRWLFTWPIVAFAIFGINKLLQKLLRRRVDDRS